MDSGLLANLELGECSEVLFSGPSPPFPYPSFPYPLPLLPSLDLLSYPSSLLLEACPLSIISEATGHVVQYTSRRYYIGSVYGC